MFIEIFRVFILANALYGFYNFLMLIERKYGKKGAFIATLIFGALALIGIILKV